MCPESMKLRYAVIVPMAYKFARILWLASIADDVAYHQATPWYFLLIGVAAVLLWVMLFDHLLSLHFHGFLGSLARLKGILNAPGIDDSLRVEVARKEIENLKQ